MARLFKDRPEAIIASTDIIHQIHFSLDDLRYEYPHEPVPTKWEPQDWLEHLVREAARERWPEGIPSRAQELIAARGHRLVRLHQESRSQSLLTYPRRTAQDWFHPNDVGYRQWADAFWASIRSSGVLEELSKA